jgi:hypothetical protein
MFNSGVPPVGGSTKVTEDAGAAEFAAGFAQVEAEVRAVPERELVAINIDVPSAVAMVLGALPELKGLRDKFAQLLGFDVARFDKLRDYTLALGHAHAMFRGAAGPSDGTSGLADQVSTLRDVLQADATALAKRKILDEAQVTKLRGGSGYKNMAFEVVGLVGLLREHWDAIQGRSALKAEELEQAGQLAQELVTAVGTKEQAPVQVGAASLLRQQAFTLFMNAYDDARRAVSYLRWNEGDVDDIAPSLFEGHGGRGTPDVQPKPPTPPGPPTPAPVATSSASVTGAAPSNAVPTGLPGSVPFARS